MVEYQRMTIAEAKRCFQEEKNGYSTRDGEFRNLPVEVIGRVKKPSITWGVYRLESVKAPDVALSCLGFSVIEQLNEAVERNELVCVKGNIEWQIEKSKKFPHCFLHAFEVIVECPGALSLFKEGLEGALSRSYDEGALSLSNPEK